MAANRIGPLLNDMNVDTTFEGDNTVLMTQVGGGRTTGGRQCDKGQAGARIKAACS